MIFSYIPGLVDPNSTSRIASQDCDWNWIPWCWTHSKE